MSGLLYFVPGVPGVLAEDLYRLGLGATFGPGAKPPPFGECLQGPDGGHGAILAPKPEVAGGRAAELGYRPATQLWKPAPGGAYWMGRELADPPRPEDLMRAEAIDGHRVRLGDGQEWLIPAARTFDEGSVLPHALVLGPGGHVVREPLERYAQVSARATRVWHWVARVNELPVQTAEELAPMTNEEAFAIAADALNLNYRLAGAEISFLQLVLDTNARAILEAFVDFPSLLARAMAEAASKKNDAATPGGSSTGAGGTGS